MAGKARRSIARQDFAPVLNLFPLVSHLMAMRGEFERSLQGCDPSVRNRISGIIDVLHQTVSGRHAAEAPWKEFGVCDYAIRSSCNCDGVCVGLVRSVRWMLPGPLVMLSQPMTAR